MADDLTAKKVHQPLTPVGGKEVTKAWFLGKQEPGDQGRMKALVHPPKLWPLQDVERPVIIILSKRIVYMTTLKIKTALLAATVLSLSAYTGLASAHCLTGRTLGAATSAVDLYRVQCFNDGSGDADHLDALVNLEAGGSSVRAQIAREGFAPSGISTDTTNAATNCAAATTITLDPSAQLAGASGNGDYNILVNKTSTSAKTYGLVFHCETAGNVETGTREVHAGSAAPELAGNAAISPDIDLLIDQ